MLFLSHSGADSAAAKELARRLREAGLDVWLDLDHLQPGDRWISELEEALGRADAFAVYVGASGIQRWVDREVRAALVRNTVDPSFRIIPILGVGAAPPEALPSFLAQHQCVDLRQEISPADLKRLIGAILARPPEVVSLLPAGTAPFRGLEYFDAEHAHLYFGRDEETQELLDKLRSDGFLAVVGASGSGKSSLVRAGLIPALHRGRFHNGGAWPAPWKIAIYRPGCDPFTELANALPDLCPELSRADRIETIGRCKEQLKLGVEGLRTCLAGLVRQGSRTLLIVDQFEEIFTLTSDHEVRQGFIETLLRISAGAGDRPVHVLIILRADFYSRCWEHTELLERIKQNQNTVLPLDGARLKEIIEKPLVLTGATVEPGLVDRILDDVGDEPGRLPLVEHALLQLWERRRESMLTHAAYDEIDGVSGALAHHADEVFTRLGEAERRIAQKIFLRLTHLGEGTEDTRRRAARDEILALGGDEAVAERVLTHLAGRDARLVVTRREGESDIVEMAHEALIREWPRLREWIKTNREALRIERRLINDTAEWVRLGKDPDTLLRGAYLAETEGWAQQHGKDLRTQEREFLEESIKARDRAIRDAAERDQRELELARRLAEAAEHAARRNKKLAGFLALAFGAAVYFFGAAMFQGVLAERRAAEAESREIAAAAQAMLARDPTEALVLAIRAGSRAGTFEAEEVLRHALAVPTARAILRGHEKSVSSAVFSPDGKLILTAGYDRTARLWSAETGDSLLVLRGHERAPLPVVWGYEDAVLDAAFSSDGSRIITGGFDRTARVWSTETGGSLLVLRGHTAPVSSVAFSPDRERILTASYDGTVRLWSAKTGDSLLVLQRHKGTPSSMVGRMVLFTQEYEHAVVDAAFSPDGQRIVTANADGTAQLWSVSTGKSLFMLRGHSNTITSVAFSPDGERVLTASYDGTARVWNATTGDSLLVLSGHEHALLSAIFSPGGWRIVTAGSDGIARLWSAETGDSLLALRGHSSRITSVAFSSDGKRVLTASNDGTARLWSLETGESPFVLWGHTSFVTSAVFSPDGQRIVTGSYDNTARVWSAETGDSILVLRGHTNAITSVVFSRDGRRILTASYDGTVRLWHVETGDSLLMLRGQEGALSGAALSPDGQRIVTAGADSTARMWSVETGDSVLVLRGHKSALASVAFSLSGRRIVTASADRTARLWNAETGKSLLVLRGHNNTLSSAAFSPDGSRIVTGSYDGTARVCCAETRDSLLVLQGHGRNVVSAVFSPDGQRILTASADGTARMWSAKTGKLQAILRGHKDEVTSAEFSPDGRRIVTASADGSARLYLTNIRDLLDFAMERAPITPWAGASR